MTCEFNSYHVLFACSGLQLQGLNFLTTLTSGAVVSPGIHVSDADGQLLRSVPTPVISVPSGHAYRLTSSAWPNARRIQLLSGHSANALDQPMRLTLTGMRLDAPPMVSGVGVTTASRKASAEEVDSCTSGSCWFFDGPSGTLHLKQYPSTMPSHLLKQDGTPTGLKRWTVDVLTMQWA